MKKNWYISEYTRILFVFLAFFIAYFWLIYSWKQKKRSLICLRKGIGIRKKRKDLIQIKAKIQIGEIKNKNNKRQCPIKKTTYANTRMTVNDKRISKN